MHPLDVLEHESTGAGGCSDVGTTGELVIKCTQVLYHQSQEHREAVN